MSFIQAIRLSTLTMLLLLGCRSGLAIFGDQSAQEITPAPTIPTGTAAQQVTELTSPVPVPTVIASTSPVQPTNPALVYPIPAIAQPSSFAAYEPIPVSIQPAVQTYSTALSSVVNPQAGLALNPAQQAALEQNGFVITPSPFPQMYQVYQNAKEQSQPIFVTTDALLHTYHVLYDFALRDAEFNHFVGNLQSLTAELLRQSQAQLSGTSAEVQQAARRNLAYFSVAAALLDASFTPPSEVADLVNAELTLIADHSGFQPSPIFGFEEDYSQYVPRGHYTRNETFERFFRAMMWYGRIGFRLQPGDDPESLEMGRMETRQAILIATMLGSTTVNGEPALAVWDRIYQPTVFFVGRADDLTVYDYLPLIQAVYGDSLNLEDLNEVARLDNFIQQAATLPTPKIISSRVTDEQDAAKVTQSFRLMGQRFVPDAYIFQQLVYNQVGTQQNPRVLPSALDVAGVLGSDRAYELSLTVYEQDKFENYSTQLESVRMEFANLPPGQWQENLYWGWLYSLAPLLSPPGEGYPTFMQNPAWVDKDLHTYLGSWAELKHDTLLYAKQSNTVGITSIQPTPEDVSGYVEPRPEVFARLAALVRQTRSGLAERNLLSDEFSNKFNSLETLLLALTEMAQKELTNQRLTPEEQTQIRDIGDLLEAITEVQDENLSSATDGRQAIVADVHTDPNTNQVLEQAVGDAFLIWVIAPVDDQPTLTQGSTFSYFEFPWPLDDRLTDEAWQALDPKPAQPIWTQSFIVP